MRTETFSISLPVEMAQIVRRSVETGAFASDSEVFREALRVWHEHGLRREAIRAQLEAAATDPVRHAAADVAEHFDRLLNTAEKTVRQ